MRRYIPNSDRRSGVAVTGSQAVAIVVECVNDDERLCIINPRQ